MAAMRESMRSPLERGAADSDERIVLGKIPTERRDAVKKPRVIGALIGIFLISLTLVLVLLVPMFYDIFQGG